MDSKLIDTFAFPVFTLAVAVAFFVYITFQRRKLRSIYRQMPIDVNRAHYLAKAIVLAIETENLDLAIRHYTELRKLAMAKLLWPDIAADFVKTACCLLGVTAVLEPTTAARVVRELRALLCRNDLPPEDWPRIEVALQTYRLGWKRRRYDALVKCFDEFLAFGEEQMGALRRDIEDLACTNSADNGKLDQSMFAGSHSPVRIGEDRVVDFVDGEAALIDEEEKLRDYLAVRDREGIVSYRGETVRVRRVRRLVYAFTEPEGVLANRVFISNALDKGVIIRVYNKAGFTREFNRPLSVDDVIFFAMSIHP